jgi:hypothetical protein
MKKLFASATILTTAIMMSVAAPSASQAVQPGTITTPSIQPYAAQGCSVNTCMYLATPSAGTVFVQGWAYNTSFYGYFRLTAPSGTYYSSTQTWLGGKGNYIQWSGVPAIVGQYCVTGFTSGGTSQGTACERVL